MPDASATPSTLTGATVLAFDDLPSTNTEALRLLKAGTPPPPFWLTARRQSAGRGRAGRAWASPEGNLHASLALALAIPPTQAAELPFVAALAVHDAIGAHLAPHDRARLKLKWPNDAMVDHAKIAGILVESQPGLTPGMLLVVVGIGINVLSAPDVPGRTVTHLAGHEAAALPVTVETVFTALDERFAHWFDIWRHGPGFKAITAAWMERAYGLNEEVEATLGGTHVRGRFRGLAPSGGLLIETLTGRMATVISGEVRFLPASK